MTPARAPVRAIRAWRDRGARGILSHDLASPHHVWTIVVAILAAIAGTIWRLEIETLWLETLRRYLVANAWSWVVTVVDYLSGFWGGVFATLVVLVILDWILGLRRRGSWRRLANTPIAQADITRASANDALAGGQERCVLSLINDAEHVQKRIQDKDASHAIKVRATTNGRLHRARPRLQNISRWQAGDWHSLNSDNRMELGWAGDWGIAYEEQDFAGKHYFALFNYFEAENRLAIVSRSNLRSFPTSRDLPRGRYKAEVKVDDEGGIAGQATFIVDWFGELDTMIISKLA